MIEVLNLILIFEMFSAWFIIFHTDRFLVIWDATIFYLKVLCGWVVYVCFNVSSTITETKSNGKIIR